MTDRNLERQLRAMREPAPPPELAARLEQGVPGSFGRRQGGGVPGRARTMARVGVMAAAVAAVVWGALMFLPGPAGPGVSVAAMLEPIARASGSAAAVHIVMRVRSRAGEDFEFVDLSAEPRTYEAWIEMPGGDGEPGRARVSKGDRISACDGRETITFHPPRGEAFRSPGCAVRVETFWPAAWVSRLRAAAQVAGTEVRENTEGPDEGRLVLREPGIAVEGREKAFLDEFDRETEITWSPGTRRLTGLRRWVLERGRHLVAETVAIEYLDAADADLFRIDMPSEVRWVSLRQAPETLAAMGAGEVARRFLAAAIAGDRETLEILGASPHAADTVLAAGVTRVVMLGEPFRTGAYPGVYVPYVILLGKGADATERRHNLALRDDNPQKRWVFDGGF
jgi:hypothetical protein